VTWKQSNTRYRFSLRSILLFAAVSALGFVTARNSDWISGLGIVLAFVIAYVAYALPTFRLRTWIRAGLIVAACAVTWMSAVDCLTCLESCDKCGIHHRTTEYRLLGLPLTRLKHDAHGDFLCRIAADLGKPCHHQYSRMPITRFWGLLYCARPCMCVMCCLYYKDNYNDKFHDRVLKFGRAHPESADEFHAKLLAGAEKDPDYLRAFIRRLDDEFPYNAQAITKTAEVDE